ncbi:MAG: transposase family protein [Thermoplasmata archaeon]
MGLPHALDRQLLVISIVWVIVRPEGKRFLNPAHPYQRRYEALRAYFIDHLSSTEVARRFGYTPRSFEALVARFRKDDLPPFWRDVRRGRQERPVREPLREAVLDLRRSGLSVYDISERLRAQGRAASHQTVWMILREAGAKRLPKRTAAQKAQAPTLDPPVADVREIDLTPREVECRAPLVLYFAEFLDRLGFDTVVRRSGYPSSAMVPSASALRSALVDHPADSCDPSLGAADPASSGAPWIHERTPYSGGCR